VRSELEMAAQLIDSFRGEWEPKKYKDTYRADLMKAVEAKRKGKDVHAAAEVEEEEELPDLLTALRESIERSVGGRSTRRRTTSRTGGLDRLSKQQLEERARKAKLPGRSKMSKDELVDALRSAA
jgi:DNA end-binding protein Ku